MSEHFLYEELGILKKHKQVDQDIPFYLKNNLHPKFDLRPYQIEAFSYFIYHFEHSEKKDNLHLLFNMATGSGKTLMMAGLILYLYKKGYRHFLFFVDSTNIIEKTKSNFLDPTSSKYLFKEDIVIDTKRVRVVPVNNFAGVNENHINICFTTIQKLHSDLHNMKENALTYQDFKNHNIVLLADEAHHINTQTKAQLELKDQSKPSWENTVENIFTQNPKNLLLEFTATIDYAHESIVDKYRDKVLYRYDLKQFYNDGYSKDVCIVQADLNWKDRILLALILSQYKREVATQFQIPLKPVILFKAEKTIAQSKENKQQFHKMIEALSQSDIEKLKQKSNLPLLHKAFTFFKIQNISSTQLVERLKKEFQESRCLSVNEESEKTRWQILLNTLEDKKNQIRAIFAVEKLNEGWDVLNLFDIVRCYENKSEKNLKKTTMREAQLIGRGARYFPFALDYKDHPYKRKFDNDLQSELRVLEQLHYHSVNDFYYIEEIRKALKKTGLWKDQGPVQLHLKREFKQTDFYKSGLIYINKRIKNTYSHIHSLSDMGVSAKNYQHNMATDGGSISQVMAEGKTHRVRSKKRQDIYLKDMSFHIILNALSENVFFHFSSLKTYFPKLDSLRQFIEDQNYLGHLAITFKGGNPSHQNLLEGIRGLLRSIENEIQKNIVEYKGREKFDAFLIKNIFKDKDIQYAGDDYEGQKEYVKYKDWYVFKAFYGNNEEKAFIDMLNAQIDHFKKKYDEIYLLRNQKHFKLYNFKDGRGFEPDFVLFLREKIGQMLTYQIFMEPKGRHLQEYDRWKEQFLEKIREKFKDQVLEFTTPARSQKYRLTGVPFYNKETENRFKESLYAVLNGK